MPRWNFSGTSWTLGFSKGSAQPLRRTAMEKAIEKAFKREGYSGK
jgi:hypothetical protein